jgi:hypothetical protein
MFLTCYEQFRLDAREETKRVVGFLQLERVVSVFSDVLLAGFTRNLGVQGNVLVYRFVPRVLGEHFEASCLQKVDVTSHIPSAICEALENIGILSSTDDAAGYAFQISQRPVDEEELNMLRISIGYMCRYGPTN